MNELVRNEPFILVDGLACSHALLCASVKSNKNCIISAGILHFLKRFSHFRIRFPSTATKHIILSLLSVRNVITWIGAILARMWQITVSISPLPKQFLPITDTKPQIVPIYDFNHAKYSSFYANSETVNGLFMVIKKCSGNDVTALK